MADNIYTAGLLEMNNISEEKNTNPILNVESLFYSYDKNIALRGVSFSVEKGKIFGLLGPNGGGKTTLFRILATFLPITPPSQNMTSQIEDIKKNDNEAAKSLSEPGSSNYQKGKIFKKKSGKGCGTVEIFGLDLVTQKDLIRARIGVVFQLPSLDIKLTVAENLIHQGHLYGLLGKELKDRITFLLTRFGIADRKKDIVETLSGGMRRRVELAKAFIHSPEILLLDEPSTGLDPGARFELWRYLTELRDKENVTILLTTHFLDEAEKCDKIAVLDKGFIVAIGKSAELENDVAKEVIVIEADDLESLSSDIENNFGKRSLIIDKTVQIECDMGHEFITLLMEKFSGRIKAITLRKPTLEDFFIRKTGHSFYEEGDNA